MLSKTWTREQCPVFDTGLEIKRIQNGVKDVITAVIKPSSIKGDCPKNKFVFFHLTITQKMTEDTKTCLRYPEDLCEISVFLCPLRKERGFKFGEAILDRRLVVRFNQGQQRTGKDCVWGQASIRKDLGKKLWWKKGSNRFKTHFYNSSSCRVCWGQVYPPQFKGWFFPVLVCFPFIPLNLEPPAIPKQQQAFLFSAWSCLMDKKKAEGELLYVLTRAIVKSKPTYLMTLENQHITG